MKCLLLLCCSWLSWRRARCWIRRATLQVWYSSILNVTENFQLNKMLQALDLSSVALGPQAETTLLKQPVDYLIGKHTSTHVDFWRKFTSSHQAHFGALKFISNSSTWFDSTRECHSCLTFQGFLKFENKNATSKGRVLFPSTGAQVVRCCLSVQHVNELSTT